jgi:hypothetical protein
MGWADLFGELIAQALIEGFASLFSRGVSSPEVPLTAGIYSHWHGGHPSALQTWRRGSSQLKSKSLSLPLNPSNPYGGDDK